MTVLPALRRVLRPGMPSTLAVASYQVIELARRPRDPQAGTSGSCSATRANIKAIGTESPATLADALTRSLTSLHHFATPQTCGQADAFCAWNQSWCETVSNGAVWIA